MHSVGQFGEISILTIFSLSVYKRDPYLNEIRYSINFSLLFFYYSAYRFCTHFVTLIINGISVLLLC